MQQFKGLAQNSNHSLALSGRKHYLPCLLFRFHGKSNRHLWPEFQNNSSCEYCFLFDSILIFADFNSVWLWWAQSKTMSSQIWSQKLGWILQNCNPVAFNWNSRRMEFLNRDPHCCNFWSDWVGSTEHNCQPMRCVLDFHSFWNSDLPLHYNWKCYGNEESGTGEEGNARYVDNCAFDGQCIHPYLSPLIDYFVRSIYQWSKSHRCRHSRPLCNGYILFLWHYELGGGRSAEGTG